MKTDKLRVLFMGTPDFAIPSFVAMCENFNVIGTLTQPDKPKGRKYVLTPPPVKIEALKRNVNVYQPETLANEAFLPELQKLSPDIIIVVAYGKILPEYVLNYPKYGCINLHGSLLPKYRGAAPMQRAIINGETHTGLTTMFMAKGLDTGDMIFRKKIKINESDNFEDIHDRLANVGAQMLVDTINALVAGNVKKTKQYGKYATYAQKIEKPDCHIDFSCDAKTVYDLIRGLSPIPLSYCLHNDKILKIVKAQRSDVDPGSALPGTVVSLDNGIITVACKNGCIGLVTIIPEGKSKMSAHDFILGRKISVKDILA